MKKLEGQELYRRLQEARNAKRLLEAQKQSNEALRTIVKKQEELIRKQEERILLQEAIIQNQALRIEYLEKIVFGKSKGKKHYDGDTGEGYSQSGSSLKNPKKRESESYQRAIPKEEEITNIKEYPMESCPDCHGPLSEKRIVQRYLEDIVLPDKKNPLKNIEKQLIESGWCKNCQAQKSAHPINGSKVLLGKNTKMMVVYLSVVMRMSYEQIRNILRDIWHLKVSDGEIENIIEEQGNRLTLEHEKIAKALLEESAHYDETTWKTTQGHFGNYSWIKTGVKSTNTLFLFGRSRGKGNAQELCGGSRHIGITDDYVGYDNVFETQALCWAHPDRKIRDLAESKVIYGKAKETCEKMHEEFKKLYKELREFQGTFKERKAKKKEYIKRYEALIVPDEHDPQKLKTYKETLRKEEKKYFTFMDIEGIPMDNNQAERRLRHVVLKRKICLGSKTDKGAKMLEKLYSVVLTWWWKDPVNFISNYRHLLA